jgi:NAD(P)-dependent dehydrogenase (short-subunit alcohol dehydrogenase family)|tara:strand:+ start:2297 stop:3136 length:840 start_codon:yes stop_codon:yes gene_type:complete
MGGRLEGKVAVITGASRGLGQYCAVGYAKEGAKIAVAARTEEVKDERLPGTIYETAKMIEDAGGEAFPVVCNVSSMESVEEMTQQVLNRWGQIDILMTNAAVQPPGFISTITPKHWELEFKVNVHGPFYCIRAALPSMIERKNGNIINISSVGALGGSHYGATKRAVEAMTIGLAGELKQHDIVVNCMKPVGGIETPGLLFGRAPGQVGGARPSDAPALPPPDSYVEAAVLLALQDVASFTGKVHQDAELIELLADESTKARFKELNPDHWVSAMSPST